MEISDSGTNSNVIEGNYIGTDAQGTNALGNASDDVAINGAAYTIVGGTAPGARNIISAATGTHYNGENGAAGSGVYLAAAQGSVIEGNYIGTDVMGTQTLGNVNGLLISSSTDTTVGGTAAGAGNLIAGSSGYGIEEGVSSGTVMEGNFIGTNQASATSLGNGSQGIFVSDSTSDTIGGTTPGAGNVISDNGVGVRLLNGTTAAQIEGNFIGVNSTGTAALGNLGDGILIEGGSTANTVSGGNVISGNYGLGIEITGSGTTSNVVEGNFIGTNASGSAGLANENGVQIDSGAASNTIGGPAPGQGNTIAFNTGAGVVVTGSTSTGNAIRGNLIYSNTGLGIDLGDTGTILADDSQGHSGPNNFANYPVITSVTAGPNTVVSGTLQNASTPGTIYYLDFYANTTQNSSGHGPEHQHRIFQLHSTATGQLHDFADGCRRQ